MHGVGQIVRLNWPFYAAAGTVVFAAELAIARLRITLLCAHVRAHDDDPGDCVDRGIACRVVDCLRPVAIVALEVDCRAY